MWSTAGIFVYKFSSRMLPHINMGEGGSRFEGGEFDAPVERSPEIEDSREAREKECDSFH